MVMPSTIEPFDTGLFGGTARAEDLRVATCTKPGGECFTGVARSFVPRSQVYFAFLSGPSAFQTVGRSLKIEPISSDSSVAAEAIAEFLSKMEERVAIREKRELEEQRKRAEEEAKGCKATLATSVTPEPSRPQIDRKQLYSVSDLKARDWTDSAITKFLPIVPDDTRPNPVLANAWAPMKFWTIKRVHRVEKTEGFLAWRDGLSKRRASAATAVDTRTRNMEKLAEEVEITIEAGKTAEEIRQLAAQTHGGNYAGDPGEFHWSNRVARNCIRHNLTNYEALWGTINRGYTGQLAYETLRARVDSLVDETYPQFREEGASVNLFGKSKRRRSILRQRW